jgi:hypothetical protein
VQHAPVAERPLLQVPDRRGDPFPQCISRHIALAEQSNRFTKAEFFSRHSVKAKEN